MYLDGELCATGRIADLTLTIDGPQPLSAGRRRPAPGLAGAARITCRFHGAGSDRDDRNQRLVIIAERAAGTSRSDRSTHSRSG